MSFSFASLQGKLKKNKKKTLKPNPKTPKTTPPF
jgi:hypothetical protein